MQEKSSDNLTCAELRYRHHLDAASSWIGRSELPTGGSAATYIPILGWSKSYPETTGYIIPTLLEVAKRTGQKEHTERALRFGEWLLSIQNSDGSWNGGKHPSRMTQPSVFNTGQILKGMLALWRLTREERWIDAADRGCLWLASGTGSDGLWRGGDYRSSGTPSYYTHVLWPMLATGIERHRAGVCDKAVRGVRTILSRRRDNGVISGWSFEDGKPAFTHTIAYTIRGIQECGLLLRDDCMLDAVKPALEILVRRAELRGGALPGAFDEEWRPAGNYVCLTGNVQISKCLLILEAQASDLRLVNAAARMIDFVCEHQVLGLPFGSYFGAVPGSQPVWGPYMRFRYPNWAAKYLCDAIIALTDRLNLIK